MRFVEFSLTLDLYVKKGKSRERKDEIFQHGEISTLNDPQSPQIRTNAKCPVSVSSECNIL